MEKENIVEETKEIVAKDNGVEFAASGEVDSGSISEPVAEKPVKEKKAKAKKEPVADGVSVDGVCVEVVGEAVHNNKGVQQYHVSVKIPRRENSGLYLREAILMQLRKEDLLYSGVLTWNTESVSHAEVPVTFIGKNIFDLSRDECFAAKAYYGLGGFACHDGDLRTLQKEIYRRFAKFFNIDNGKSEEYLKWEPIVLKRMVCPQGDTVLPVDLPVAFDDFGDSFRKTFRKLQ